MGFPDNETEKLYENVILASRSIGLEEPVTRSDMKEAARYGISLFPALVIDGKVVCEGQVYAADDLVPMIIKA